jgi:hypothetical protein
MSYFQAIPRQCFDKDLRKKAVHLLRLPLAVQARFCFPLLPSCACEQGPMLFIFCDRTCLTVFSFIYQGTRAISGSPDRAGAEPGAGSKECMCPLPPPTLFCLAHPKLNLFCFCVRTCLEASGDTQEPSMSSLPPLPPPNPTDHFRCPAPSTLRLSRVIFWCLCPRLAHCILLFISHLSGSIWRHTRAIDELQHSLGLSQTYRIKEEVGAQL